jgi:hypothetical protein
MGKPSARSAKCLGARSAGDECKAQWNNFGNYAPALLNNSLLPTSATTFTFDSDMQFMSLGVAQENATGTVFYQAYNSKDELVIDSMATIDGPSAFGSQGTFSFAGGPFRRVVVSSDHDFADYSLDNLIARCK